MAIVLRGSKGQQLSFAELDGNFVDLDNRLKSVETADQTAIDYNDIVNRPSLFSGSYADLTGKPDLFDGNYNNLANLPSIPQDLSDLQDVIGGATTGQVLKFNGANWVPSNDESGVDLTVQTAVPSGSGNLTVDNTTSTLTFTPANLGSFSFSETTIDTADNVAVTINPDITFSGAVAISQAPFRLANFTTAERDNLTPVDGDTIYNSTLGKFQGYANGTWVDLH